MKVGKFGIYNISLRNFISSPQVFEYVLDSQFFKLINDVDSDIKKGLVNVILTVKPTVNAFEFDFNLSGEVQVPCDRCLDDMPMEISSNTRIFVKLGQEYAEESDEIVVVPEDEGAINVSWFLYEFIMLCLPIKRVHPSGKCNRQMSSKLNKHRAVSADDVDSDSSDDFESSDDVESFEDNTWSSPNDLNIDE